MTQYNKDESILPEHFRQHAIREKNNYELIESFYNDIEKRNNLAIDSETDISRNIQQFSLRMRDIMFKLTEPLSEIEGIKQYISIDEKEKLKYRILEYKFMNPHKKEKIEKEIFSIRYKIFLSYQPFTLASTKITTNPGLNRLNIRFQTENMFEKSFITFCEIENLNFTHEQLLTMTYFFKKFPLHQKNSNVPTSLEKRNEYQKSYDKYVLFYRHIIVPAFINNREKYKTIEDCFADIADNFNRCNRLSMTYIEMMEFFDRFEYVKDIPLPVAINIYFDGEIIENVEKSLTANLGTKRLSEKEYNSSLAFLKKELEKTKKL